MLYVCWLERIRRPYDELHQVMRQSIEMAPSRMHLNSMKFDGTATNPIQKATRDAVFAFMAAQGEADYLNRNEMQRPWIAIGKANASTRAASTLLPRVPQLHTVLSTYPASRHRRAL